MRQPVYVFDVDGVLRDIGEGMNLEVIARIAQLLHDGAHVAINTGRNQKRMHMVLDPLHDAVKDSHDLDHFMMATEMGGVIFTFQSGKHTTSNTQFKLDAALKERANRMYHPDKHDTMEISEKDSMATFVIREGADRDRFTAQRDELVKQLEAEFTDADVVILPNLESIDVHAPHAGKQAGAQVIYEWLNQVSDITHDDFICFGDNNNDYDMARWFAEQGRRVRFVFTGRNLDVEYHAAVEVIDTDGLYTKGTLEFLDTLKD
ncbi:HAD hydrolase family protein [Candidatus Saccharibacteria bacterium]|nr:HAD hydrolase family protein [Candidatus Saccharibacteria bacterium]